MRNYATLAACSALAVSACASADFVGLYSAGWTGVNSDGSTGAVGTTDYCVLDVYAQFDSNESDGFAHADATLLSTFNSNVAMSGGEAFIHNDILGGTWLPIASSDDPSSGGLPWADSFLMVGGTPGLTNTTIGDPNLNSSDAAVLTAGAGWYNNNPNNLQGRVDTSLRTMIGRFVVDTDGAIGASLDMTLSSSYNYGIGTGTFFTGEASGSWTIVPAPGAFALMGLAGIVGRRRRA